MSTETQKPPLFGALLEFLFKSSIGLKVVMAVTGVMMWGFVVGHMLGNLQVFAPTASGEWGSVINHYAHTLKTTAPLLWGTRIAMLTAIVLHVYCGITLAAQNRAARPIRYGAPQQFAKSSVFGRIMPVSGILLLAFIVMHLLHFTIPSFNKTAMAYSFQGQPDVGRMVAEAFASPLFTGIYILGVLAVVAHLFHGSKSFLQSLSLQHKNWTPSLAFLGRLVVVLILIGNLAIPTILFSYAQQNPNWLKETRKGKITVTQKAKQSLKARKLALPRRKLPKLRAIPAQEAGKRLKAIKAARAAQ